MSPVAWNPGAQPVVIDADGRQIYGRDWRQVDPTNPYVADALTQGLLVLRDHAPNEGDDPRAVAVYDQAAADDYDANLAAVAPDETPADAPTEES